MMLFLYRESSDRASNPVAYKNFLWVPDHPNEAGTSFSDLIAFSLHTFVYAVKLSIAEILQN